MSATQCREFARGESNDFLGRLKAEPDVHAELSDKELEANVDLDDHLKHVDTILNSVLGNT